MRRWKWRDSYGTRKSCSRKSRSRFESSGKKDVVAEMKELIGKVAIYGGLGAKTQMGFGQIELVTPPGGLVKPSPSTKFFWHEITVDSTKSQNWPKGATYVPLGLHIRNAVLRPAVHEKFERYLFGEPGFSSRLHVSHPFRSKLGDPFRIRIWGEAEDANDKDIILHAIQGAMKQYE